ncbi:hypothetical protein HPB47_026121 [Ixodes persulcatus]|uniref:Uncharacterized protein n=1 Tax=Ixodes persulcatus TaxID=34615 RepID=A0AC60PZJ4_IXOPE|nr:hypothetical protein HPB47_026121 [Ixodes persulcatus]
MAPKPFAWELSTITVRPRARLLEDGYGLDISSEEEWEGPENAGEAGEPGDALGCSDSDSSQDGFENPLHTTSKVTGKEKTTVWLLEDNAHAGNRLDRASGKLKPTKELKAEGRGSSSVCTSTDNITITRWFDNFLVHIASSYVGRETKWRRSLVQQEVQKILDVPRPLPVKTYNQHMGGVDIMDSMVARYRNDVRNKRGYMRIFCHLVNIAVVNAWFIWKVERHPVIDLLEFRSRVDKALIYGGEAAHGAKKRGRTLSSSPLQPVKRRAKHDVPLQNRLDGGAHYPRKMTLKNAQRCHSKNCQSKMRYSCGRCDVHLCPECFEEFQAS